MNFPALRTAAIAAAAIFSMAPLCAQAEITYEYTGTIFNGPSSLVGKAITATFVIDDSVAGIQIGADADNIDRPFSVLSATYTFEGLTFSSKPMSHFNTSANYLLPTNRNYVKVNNNIDDPNATANFNAMFLNVYSNETHGGITSSTMTLRVADFPSYSAVNSPALPTDFSGLTPGSGFGVDSITIGMGYNIGSTFSTITSGNGTLRVLSPVPEPETYAMLLAGLGSLIGVARRRKTKASA